MKIYLEEKIGNPELFTGRKNELTKLLEWTDKIRRKLGPSRAILSRRKTGKTAILQRLFNIVYHQNDRVVPFYFEVRESKQWHADFCKDFYLTFICQYTAFVSRNPEYLRDDGNRSFETAEDMVRREKLEYLIPSVRGIRSLYEEETELIWHAVRDAPRGIAQHRDMRVLQIIDEFQYLNRKIYLDKEKTRLADDFALGYSSTAEYKNAPLLVSGSWVGWLLGDLLKMPARFRFTRLSPLPEDEATEMIWKYSVTEGVPVTDETAHLIAGLSEGNAFYISELMRSDFPGKDLTTPEGVLATLEFETLHDEGSVRSTWMEYADSAFSRVNARNAKNIVLYLCKHRDREVTRKEIREKVVPEMNDADLEKKLKALMNADIIERGRSSFFYRGVQDNIFDKVFRGEFADEIDNFDPREITDEYKAMFDDLLAKYRKLMGKHGQLKGKFAEFMIIRVLMREAYQENERFKSAMSNLPDDFEFAEYQSVWSWSASPVHKRDVQVDVFARAKDAQYSLIGEVKNLERPRFSREEAEKFAEKAAVLRELEEVSESLLFVFSRAGFTRDALDFMKANGMAWSDDPAFLKSREKE
ncbi:MAG: hypothetical protein B6245_06270 [Desulfobacteraceae bacterium 4572_88]|nr:MAG: hypothetical protein B6245_06270 [Desulfobacteraceae bacterium 4572_88]